MSSLPVAVNPLSSTGLDHEPAAEPRCSGVTSDMARTAPTIDALERIFMGER